MIEQVYSSIHFSVLFFSYSGERRAEITHEIKVKRKKTEKNDLRRVPHYVMNPYKSKIQFIKSPKNVWHRTKWKSVHQ